MEKELAWCPSKNTEPEVEKMRQRFPVLVLVVGLAYAQGCATYRVTIPDSDPQVQTYRGGAMHAYFWGKWYDPEVMAAECQGEGVNDVGNMRGGV